MCTGKAAGLKSICPSIFWPSVQQTFTVQLLDCFQPCLNLATCLTTSPSFYFFISYKKIQAFLRETQHPEPSDKYEKAKIAHAAPLPY